jgi:hypothetical protein
VRDEVASVGELSPFQAVGLGYSRKQDPIGRLTFIYATADDAFGNRGLVPAVCPD